MKVEQRWVKIMHCFHDQIKFVPRGSNAALFSIAFSTLLSLFGQVEAATITAKSVSFADVSSAVASAKDGDTVTVPAGTATWTTPLIITNNIILQGAGTGATVIIDEVPGTASKQPLETDEVPRTASKQSLLRAAPRARVARPAKARSLTPVRGRKQRSFLISISLARDLPFRMTGFTFKGGTVDTQKAFNGQIRIDGNGHSFRVDHCTFDQLHGVSLATDGFLWGVIDHCRFNTSGSHPIIVKHQTWNGKDKGHGSWADDPHWGSERFVFIEDNVFEDASPHGTGIDSFEGARFVVRYNQFHNVRLTMHGTEGQGRGAKQAEEYNNSYVFTISSQAGLIRSGCIISHDNAWTNVAKGHVLQAHRQFRFSTRWGWANGQNPYDDNAPKETTGYWETGTHTGAKGATVLTDSTKNWTPNQWYVPGVNYIVRNMTHEAVATSESDKIQSFITANTANTITCTFKSNPPLTFNTGDTYQIWKIVHSLDQPGLGKGDLLAGLPGLPARWPRQVTEPCYSWNNTQAGEASNFVSPEPSIKEDRDFFNGTPKPGYKPYIYPHPLVSGTPPHPPRAIPDQDSAEH